MHLFLWVFFLLAFNIPVFESTLNAEIHQTLPIKAELAKFAAKAPLLNIDNDKFFLVITVPKSGSYLLKIALEELTGRSSFGPTYSEECILKINKNFNDLTSFVIAHTESTFLNYVKQRFPKNVKIILMIRDFRDMIVSAVNYINKHGVIAWGGLGEIITDQQWIKMPRHQKMAFIMQLDDYGNEYEYLKGSSIAKSIVRTFPNVYVCRFENLVGAKGGGNDDLLYQELINLAQFLNVDVETTKLQNMVSHLHGTKTFTFNEGKIGKWKEEFDNNLKKLFKKQLGHTLIEWGYETDNQW